MAILDQTHPGGNERIHKIKTSGTRAGSEVTYFHNTLPYVSYIQEDQSGSESVHEKVDTAPAKLRQVSSRLPVNKASMGFADRLAVSELPSTGRPMCTSFQGREAPHRTRSRNRESNELHDQAGPKANARTTPN